MKKKKLGKLAGGLIALAAVVCLLGSVYTAVSYTHLTLPTTPYV